VKGNITFYAEIYRVKGYVYEIKPDYNKALEIDPRHKGTHEYLGKLYLNLKQPENAKKHLAKLDSICFFGCEEYTSLKEAVDGYGKNGTYRKY